MKIVQTNDINYILGIIIAFYAAYILHYNIKFKVPIIIFIPLLILILYIAPKNITLGIILSVALIVSINGVN
jgi:hypothetical protein